MKAKKNKHAITAKKPASIMDRPIKVKFTELFKSLAKGLIQSQSSTPVTAGKDLVDATSSVSFGDDFSGVAWQLIYRSFAQALAELVEEHQDIIFQDENNQYVKIYRLGMPSDDPDALLNKLDFTLEAKETEIDNKFFEHPADIPVLKDVEKTFIQWLRLFGVNEAQATSIANSLQSYFVFALNDQWRNRPEDYVSLKQAFDTPFTKASEREQAWIMYSAWLKKKTHEPMFAEAFSLNQVYVPLRAYYEEKKAKDSEKNKLASQSDDVVRVVIDLEQYLKDWLKKNDANDSIKVISGGPGAGKSSFTKMFAASLSDDSRRVLYIPLHLLELTKDLIDAIDNFVKTSNLLTHNPIDREDGDPKLLIIFDGLDELTMQGKMASETAQQFLLEVERKTETLNLSAKGGVRLKVLISGREVSVQSNANLLRKDQQVIHILPYYLSDEERKRYKDQKDLLKTDQRQIWWKRYGVANGKNYEQMPNELKREDFEEITSQPLLNYLVALSYERKKLNLSEETNLNSIYADLLSAVYERKWATTPHPALLDVQEEDFIRILEEIAISTWHGDGRKTTVGEIESHCEKSGLKKLLDALEEGASKGVTRLLMAFYFRQAGTSASGDRTFEFTHKSFGEYLVARRIVATLRHINHEFENRPKYGAAFKEQNALERWIHLCGAVALDRYILKFIRNEMNLEDTTLVENFQKTLCQLIEYTLANGIPMESVFPRPSFLEECKKSRNAEEALLVVLNSCARKTKKISEINWQTNTTFGEWLKKLQGQRLGPLNQLIFECLGFLNLDNCSLDIADLYEANLSNSTLRHAHLNYAVLTKASLHRVTLERSSLIGVDLRGVDLRDTHLRGAILDDSKLESVDLRGVDLRDTHLRGANLEGANLEGANLEGANLEGANLEGVDLQGARLDFIGLEYVKKRIDKK